MNTTIYSHEKIGLLKQMLVNSTEAGKPSDYEIRVDDMKVVPRTNDIDQFDNHEEFITDETRKVVVLVYDGNSRRNVRYNYKLQEEKQPLPQQNGLSGVEVEKIISEKLQQEKKQWQQELLEKENKELKKKLSEADEHIDKLSSGIENLKSHRKAGDIQWAELIGAAGESILRRNTHLIAKVPGMGALAGVIEQDNKNQQQVESPKPQGEASFKMKKSEQDTEQEEQKEDSELSEEDKDRIDVLKQLEQGFNKEQMNHLITLINVLVHNPKSLEPCIMYAAEWKEKQQQPTQESKPKIKNEETKTHQEVKQEIKTEKQEQISQEENKSTTENCSEDDLVSNHSY
ncbi:MAG: hypothetical protein AABZ32_02405 [Bacteroidota bacterium]